ncbi:MAG: M23 family metallopeptidase [Proteobacteria bacterium]|nr:M23 family metallopeptidase [Pseudomonadota bacterium]
MNSSPRHRAPRALAVLLVLSLAGSLSGCLGVGSTRLAGPGPWPDPPPIPLRKPAPPAVRPALASAAPIEVRAVVRAVTRGVTAAPVTTASLEPLQKPAALARVPAPAPTPAPGRRATVSYRVQAGDTVYGVARRFAVPLRTMIDANRLTPPYALRVGQALRVPNPRRHIVAAGDTVYGVARRYGVPAAQLVRLNAIKPPYTISPGQDLILPVPVRVARAPRRQVAGAGAARAVTRTVARPAALKVALKATQAPAPQAIRQPPARAGGKFLWPVRGRTIVGYGPKKNGLHNDGINIAAPRGAPVQAAENGVVAYIGNELRGFGNLILIRHAGGWVTAYAHNADFLVRRGDTVKRGQVIARIGSSGNVATPQLHFEIRKGARSVDPTRFLGPQRAAALAG